MRNLRGTCRNRSRCRGEPRAGRQSEYREKPPIYDRRSVLPRPQAQRDVENETVEHLQQRDDKNCAEDRGNQ